MYFIQEQSYVEVGPRVSDNSLESRSQDLIDRGSSLVSSPSSQATSLTVKNYFNSEKQPSGDSCQKRERQPGAEMKMVNTGREPMAMGGRPECHEEDILYQWRLRRRLEEARREAIFVSEQARQFHPSPAAHLRSSLWSVESHDRLAAGGGRRRGREGGVKGEACGRTGLTGIRSRSDVIGDGLTDIETGLTGSRSGLSGMMIHSGTGLTDNDLPRPHACTCTCSGRHGNTSQADVHVDVVDSHGTGDRRRSQSVTSRGVGSAAPLTQDGVRKVDQVVQTSSLKAEASSLSLHVQSPGLDSREEMFTESKAERKTANSEKYRKTADISQATVPLTSGSGKGVANINNTVPPQQTLPPSSEGRVAVDLATSPPPNGPDARLQGTTSQSTFTSPSCEPEETAEVLSQCDHRSEEGSSVCGTESSTGEEQQTGHLDEVPPPPSRPPLSLSHGEDVSGGHERSMVDGGAEEMSYWTITPCVSPDSGGAVNIAPLLNEVDQLFYDV